PRDHRRDVPRRMGARAAALLVAVGAVPPLLPGTGVDDHRRLLLAPYRNIVPRARRDAWRRMLIVGAYARRRLSRGLSLAGRSNRRNRPADWHFRVGQRAGLVGALCDWPAGHMVLGPASIESGQCWLLSHGSASFACCALQLLDRESW